MKKRICFTGFPFEEALALQAFPGLAALGECRFVLEADAALTVLAGETFDLFVANLSASGKRGIESLLTVGRLHPNIVKFIVGELGDQAQIVNSIGPHQFVRRPVTPAELIATLQRGLRLEAWLSNDELRKLMPRLRRLPSLPSTYFDLLNEIESPAATLQDIGNIIARDPVITARLLQLVNSAAFSLAQKVTHPADAVSLLGIHTVKSLVLCVQVFGRGDEARETGLSLENLWTHSFLVAKYARQIGLQQTGDARLADDAFTAGLLHDVGRIVIASNLPKEYAAVVAAAREKSRPLHEEETAQLGANHAKVGAYLLGLWGLPAPFIEATAAHHAPGQTVFACEFSLLAAVHAANVFAHATSPADGLPRPELDLAYYEMIKLEDQLAGWREACAGLLALPPEPAGARAISTASPGMGLAPAKPHRPGGDKGSGRWWKLAGASLLVLIGWVVWFYWNKSAAGR